MYSKATEQKIKNFLKDYGNDCFNALNDTGIFIAAFIPQCCLESGYGTDSFSSLTKNYNNWGGIKDYGNTSGSIGSITADTTEYNTKGNVYQTKAPFAKFATPLDGFRAQVHVWQLDRYQKQGIFQADSPEGQIKALCKGGYTTTPYNIYLFRLKGMIECCQDILKIGKISGMQQSVFVDINSIIGGSTITDFLKNL